MGWPFALAAILSLLAGTVSRAQTAELAASLAGSSRDGRQTDARDKTLAEVPDDAASQPGGGARRAADLTPPPSTGVHRGVIVKIGRAVDLKRGDTAETVVVIGGSATIHGEVHDALVVIGGNAEVDGQVGNEVVDILGDLQVGRGAQIHGDAVAVGGKINVADGAKIWGQLQEIDLAGAGFLQIRWLKSWVAHCALWLRPLAPQVPWAWGIALGFFILYAIIAVLFPRPVAACVEELNRRPATSFLMGLLTKLLVPLVIVILVVTGIGVVVVPFVLAALFLGGLLGKTAVLEWIGSAILRQSRRPHNPLPALLLGAAVLTFLYMVPVLGLVAFAVASLWGIGAVVMAAFGGMRREMPEKPLEFPTGTVPPYDPAPYYPVEPSSSSSSLPARPLEVEAASSHTAHVASPTISEPPRQDETEPLPGPAAPAMPLPPPIVSEALSYPRAGFWERMGAGFLDVVLVSIISGFVGPFGFLLALAYFTGMWAWKGTTIGGVVLSLKVVRQDGEPMTLLIALVRALAASFSVVVLFLGFLWIAWDEEKQGWHDRIAGTVVVRLPRPMSLLSV